MNVIMRNSKHWVSWTIMNSAQVDRKFRNSSPVIITATPLLSKPGRPALPIICSNVPVSMSWCPLLAPR